MWRRCDYERTRIVPNPARVMLAPATSAKAAATDPAPWLAVRGAAAVLPCPPRTCADAAVVLADPAHGLFALAPDGWQALPMPRPRIYQPAGGEADFTPTHHPPRRRRQSASRATRPGGSGCWTARRRGCACWHPTCRCWTRWRCPPARTPARWWWHRGASRSPAARNCWCSRLAACGSPCRCRRPRSPSPRTPSRRSSWRCCLDRSPRCSIGTGSASMTCRN